MSKLTSCLTLLFLACSPYFVATEDTSQPQDMAQDMTHEQRINPDLACAPGYMLCYHNEQPVCEPAKCGGCSGVVCSPNQPDCCNNVCTNLRNYAANCGLCGVVCQKGAYCAEGVCVTK